MALASFSIYPSAMQAFVAHWTAVNAASGATPLVLHGGYTLANFTTDRAALQTAITTTETTDNTRQAAAGDRDLRKTALKPRIAQFRNAARYFLLNTPYEKALPKQPPLTASEGKFLRAFDDAASLWTTLNAIPATGAGSIAGFTPPLKLFGNYALADFNTELAALRAAYISLANAAQNAKINRGRRDALLAPIDKRLVEYRKAVFALFAPTDALVMSLPRAYTPSGRTPDAISLSAAWNVAQNQGILTITESADPDLDYYSVRTAPAPYHARDESVIGRIEKGSTTFETKEGLAATGSIAYFKVYVVLKTGREKGSATEKITRTT